MIKNKKVQALDITHLDYINGHTLEESQWF